MSIFTLPDLGEGLTEAQLVRWLVDVGDAVAVDAPVAEVETAKAVVEVPSPYAGVVARLRRGSGADGRPRLTTASGTGPRPSPGKKSREGNVMGVLGIVLNRFNISLVAFNWQLPSVDRYFPSAGEITISLFVVTIGVIAFRFIVTRMPIFYVHPAYKDSSH